MTVRAELHDGTVLEFPDGTPDAVVSATVKRVLGGGLSSGAPAPALPSAPVDGKGPGMPGAPAPAPAKWNAASPGALDEPDQPAALGGRTGAVSNFAAGANEFIADTLGAPVDLANWLLRGVDAGVNAVTGGEGRRVSSERPFGGSESIKALMGLGGFDPRDTTALTPTDRIARGSGAGVAGAALPWGAARGLLASGAAPAAGAGRAVVEGLAAGGMGANAGIGGAAGAAGAATAERVDDPRFKPLADMGGQLAGGAGAALGGALLSSAARRVGSVFSPFTAGGRERVVADALRGQASDAGSLPARIADTEPELVPGSMPTLGQLTGDAGVLALERGVSRRNPAPFLERAAEQTAARSALVEGLAPTDARPDSVGALFRRQVADLDAAFTKRLDDATAARDTAVQGMGGTEDKAVLGGRLRADIEAAKAEEKAVLNRLYAAVDPDGTLALDIGPVKSAARELTRDVVDPAILGGSERTLLGVVDRLRPVETFGRLQDLRSELMGAIRAERATGGETPALRRLTILRSAIDDTIGGALDRAAPEGVSAKLGGNSTRAAGGGTAAPPSRVFTPGGRSVDVQYEVVEGSTLRPAAGDLQPRDRTRAASDTQIAAMASRLQPERLGYSADAGSGAPIVGPDGIIESGNGRTAAILRALDAGGPAGQGYRDYLGSLGYDVSGMRQPVLVARRTSDLSPADRVRFVQEANTGPGLALSPTERAVADAGRLKPDVLGLYAGGDLTDAGNRDFVRAFMGSVPERNDLGTLATADGRLSEDGLRRMRYALAQHAYDDADLVAALAETGDDAIRSFGGALLDAAPALARLRGDVAAGRVKPEMDLGASVREAARIVRDARTRRVPLADAVGQMDAFAARDPVAVDLLRAAYGDDLSGRISRGRLVEVLRAYANEAGRQTTEAGLFGDALGEVRAGDVLRTARRIVGEGPAADAGAPAPAAAAPEAAPASTRNASVVDEALTPNFGSEDAARYRAASDAYRGYAERFKGGPVGASVAVDRGGAFRVPDSGVAGRFFHGGARGREDVEAFAAAMGSRESAVAGLIDYAASSLRSYAVREDGSLDPRKYSAWLSKHGDALKALDNLSGGKQAQARFRRAAEAQRLVDGVAAERTRTMGELQDGAARFFLGDVDPVSAVGSALRSSRPREAFAELRTRIGGDADALAGLRRAVIEHMKRELQSTVEAGDTGLGVWRSDATQKWVATHKEALRSIFTPEQVASLEALAADLQRSNRSVSGSKLPGGSDTVQNAASVDRLPGQSLLSRMLSASGIAGGAYGGAALGGPVGGLVGALAAEVFRAGRASAMERVNDLLTAAVLDPGLARTLLLRHPGADVPASVATRLRNALIKAGVMSGTRTVTEDDANAARRADVLAQLRRLGLGSGGSSTPAPPVSMSVPGLLMPAGQRL